jgi:hypothetical protein
MRNKVAPEGCIAEGYIATELVTFYSRYLDNAPTFTTDLREILMVQRGREREYIVCSSLLSSFICGCK